MLASKDHKQISEHPDTPDERVDIGPTSSDLLEGVKSRMEAIVSEAAGNLLGIYDLYSTRQDNILREHVGFWTSFVCARVSSIFVAKSLYHKNMTSAATAAGLLIMVGIFRGGYFGKIGSRQLLRERIDEGGLRAVSKSLLMGNIGGYIAEYPYGALLAQKIFEKHPRILLPLLETNSFLLRLSQTF